MLDFALPAFDIGAFHSLQPVDCVLIGKFESILFKIFWSLAKQEKQLCPIRCSMRLKRGCGTTNPKKRRRTNTIQRKRCQERTPSWTSWQNAFNRGFRFGTQAIAARTTITSQIANRPARLSTCQTNKGRIRQVARVAKTFGKINLPGTMIELSCQWLQLVFSACFTRKVDPLGIILNDCSIERVDLMKRTNR